MIVALVYNAKPGARTSIRNGPHQVLDEEGDPVPLDALENSEEMYSEWDGAETILAVADALATRHSVVLLEAGATLVERLKQAQPDLVFNMAEGLTGPGREAQVPMVLEMLGIPYTGSDPATLALCLDKGWTKAVLAHEGVPVPNHVTVYPDAPLPDLSSLSLPVIVKPAWEGSSKGIRDNQLVHERKVLLNTVEGVLDDFNQPVLVEQFLTGREFTVAALGNTGEWWVLPPVEIVFKDFPAGSNPIYSWEAKWVWDRPEAPLSVFQCPAKLTPVELAQLEGIVIQTLEVLRVRDWARVDVRMDQKGKPHIIEINPLPGVLPNPEDNSCFPKAARATGLSYTDLILSVVDAALDRLGVPHEFH